MIVLQWIKNHIKRVWQGTESPWKIALIWGIMLLALSLIVRYKLVYIGILLIYSSGFEQLFFLFTWFGILILPCLLVFYTIFLFSAWVRKTIRGPLYSHAPVDHQTVYQDNKKYRLFFKYFPDILVIAIVVGLSAVFIKSFILTAFFLIIIYFIIALLVGWYAFLKSRAAFIFKIFLFLLFPIFPIAIGILNYSGFCIAERKWYSDEEKIHQVVENINEDHEVWVYLPGVTNAVNFKRIAYANVGEFLAENPGCCEIYSTFHENSRDFKGKLRLLYRNLTGDAYKIVAGEFYNFYLDANHNKKSQLSRIYAKVNNCSPFSVDVRTKNKVKK